MVLLVAKCEHNEISAGIGNNKSNTSPHQKRETEKVPRPSNNTASVRITHQMLLQGHLFSLAMWIWHV
jgi:hypothetical protein